MQASAGQIHGLSNPGRDGFSLKELAWCLEGRGWRLTAKSVEWKDISQRRGIWLVFDHDREHWLAIRREGMVGVIHDSWDALPRNAEWNLLA